MPKVVTERIRREVMTNHGKIWQGRKEKREEEGVFWSKAITDHVICGGVCIVCGI